MKTSLFFLAAAISITACKKSEKSIRAEIKDINESVYASGNIFPKNEYKVFANADGFLTEIFKQEGDTIQKGEILFKIESDIQNARNKSAIEIYRKSLENIGPNSPVIAEMENNLKSSIVKLKNDSINYFRFKSLYEKNAVSKVDFEKTELAYNISRNEVAAKKSGLAKLKNQLFVEYQNAEANFKVTEKDADNFSIKSIINGLVYEINKELGEVVRKNETLAIIGSKNDFYIHLNVDELDISKIKFGQKVLVKIDVFGNKIFEAKVSKIYPKLNKQDQSFKIEAEFENEKPIHFYGLTVEANILIQHKKEALVIPKSYLIGKDSLIVDNGNGKEKIKIEKGIENIDFVEVISGIDKNSEVFMK